MSGTKRRLVILGFTVVSIITLAVGVRRRAMGQDPPQPAQVKGGAPKTAANRSNNPGNAHAIQERVARGEAPSVKKTIAFLAGLPALPDEPNADDIHKLKKARALMAQRSLDDMKQTFESGRISLGQLFEAERLVLDAELDATDDPVERLKLWEGLYDHAKGAWNQSVATFENGHMHQSVLFKARQRLLEFEIELGKARIAAKKK